MAWFILLERRENAKYVIIHCRLDDFIPFCEIFIIPYLFWFVYIAVGSLFLFFQTDHIDDFYRLAAALLLGMTTCLIIYTVFPNAQDMRPKSFERNNVFTRVISILYAADTDTNVCPSIHVYNSIAMHVGIAKSHYFRERRVVKGCSLAACVLICLSTLFLKQHSFIDLACAAALYIFYYIVIYKLFPVLGARAKRGPKRGEAS